MKPPSEQLRQRWLEALLPLVPDRGWTPSSAERAAEIAELTPGEQALAAPGGLVDLIDHFFDAIEDEVRAELAETDMDGLRVPEKVAFGVRTWLDALEPQREAVSRASVRAFRPDRTSASVRRLWSVADLVWDAAGDEATDYNRYTKRGLLVSVLPAIFMYWQSAPESDALDGFIARRLARASQLGQAGGRVFKPMLDFLTRANTPKSDPTA